MSAKTKPVQDPLTERLAARGLRSTSQREHVYKLLLEGRDHPTAEQVFMRAKAAMPEISMATVYNCLDALVKCGLVKEVCLDRGASRYCPNMREHYHFYCSECGEVYDIDLPTGESRPPLALPLGFQPKQYEIAVRGVCPDCGGLRVKNGARH
jgi:Fur family peroxide stress response transcriptional regulator